MIEHPAPKEGEKDMSLYKASGLESRARCGRKMAEIKPATPEKRSRITMIAEKMKNC